MPDLTPEQVARIEEAARAGGGHRLQFIPAERVLALCAAWRELQAAKKLEDDQWKTLPGCGQDTMPHVDLLGEDP